MILSARDQFLVEALLDARYTSRLLADGDSWFSIGGWTGNLLQPLDDGLVLIVNCAYPGDELADSRAIGNDEFAALLAPTDGIAQWDGVLLSAGGNDVIKAAGDFVCGRAEEGYLDRSALDEVLDAYERQLIRFLRLCHAAQPGVPVFCHTYDYPPVARRWHFWHIGPWLAPIFRAHDIPRGDWHAISVSIIDELAERMFNVAGDWPVLTVVDTRDHLGTSDWRNEIHPSVRGYAVLGRVFKRGIERRLSKGAPT